MNIGFRKLQSTQTADVYPFDRAAVFAYAIFVGTLLMNYFVSSTVYSAFITGMGAVMAFVFDPVYMLVPCLITDAIQSYFLITETLSISRILTLVMIAAMILKKQGSFRLKRFDFFLIFFAGYYLLTTLWSIESTYADGVSLCISILIIILARNYSTGQIRGLWRLMVLAAAAFGLLVAVLTFAGIEIGEENSQIVFAEDLNANTVAGCLALMGVIVYGASLTAGKKGLRILGYLYTMLMAVAILYVGSRAALLGLVLTVLLLPLIGAGKELKKKVRALLIIAALLAIVLYIVMESNQEIRERFFFRDRSGELSVQRRYDVWRVLFAEFIPKHPLFGIGFGISNVKTAVAPFLDYPRHAHNMYIGLLAETGLVGLSAFLVFIICSIRDFCRERMPLFGAYFGMILFGLMLGIGEEVVNRKWFWIAFAIGYLAQNNFRSEDAPATAAEET